MSVQDSYTINMTKAFAGMIADQRPREIDSKVWEGTTSGRFGIFAARGTATGQAKLPTTNSLPAMLGPIVASHTSELGRANGVSDTTIEIAAGAPLNVMREGNIYVEVENACTAGNDVYVRFAGKQQVQTITFSGDLVTANVVNLKVGGVAISPVTFATDNATTMAAVGAAIDLASGGLTTTVVTSANLLTVTTDADVADQDITLVVVTLGASQATAIVAETHASFNSTGTLGQVRADADTDAAVAVDWQFEESGVAGAVVKIRKK